MKDYPFLYETHLHCKEASACARSSAKEMAEACKKAGYTGIIMTNHNWGGNTSVYRKLPWEYWVEQFYEPYLIAKEWGDAHELQVFFGYEAGYEGTEFLIYGVDDKWLKDHPEIRDASIEEQYRLVHEAGGMVVQAHPFRKEDYIPEIRLFPQFVDGVEGINATHSNHLSRSHNVAEWDRLAIEYARREKLPMTAGSDVHNTLIFGGGMAFRRKLESIQDFCHAVMNREDYVLTNGDEWFTREGEKTV